VAKRRYELAEWNFNRQRPIHSYFEYLNSKNMLFNIIFLHKTEQLARLSLSLTMKERETHGLRFKLRNPTTSRTSLLNEIKQLCCFEEN